MWIMRTETGRAGSFILKEPGSREAGLEGYPYLDKFMDLKEMRRTIRSGQEGTERKQDA